MSLHKVFFSDKETNYAETVSGGAMAGAIAPVILKVRPLASGASINYLKIAKGMVEATATISVSGFDLLELLKTNGYANFSVVVDMTDEKSQKVAEMMVDWNVKVIK